MKTSFAVGLCVLFIAAYAYGDDLFPPDWRGDPGSTYQVWTFEDDDNPAAPEVDNNPYGTPMVSLVGSMLGWYDTSPPGTGQGFWADIDLLDLWIPNQPEPNAYKEIWLQVTYLRAGSDPYWAYVAPEVEVPGATYLEGEDVFVEHWMPDYPELGEWRLQLSKWLIVPNPPEETIFMTWPPPDSAPRGVVTQIVVDTICVPEPASLTLLGAAGLALLRRRSARY